MRASFSLAYASRAQIAFPFPYERLSLGLSSSWEVRRLSLDKVIKSKEFDRGDSIQRLNLASLRSWQGQERLGNRERQHYAPRQRAPLLCAEAGQRLFEKDQFLLYFQPYWGQIKKREDETKVRYID